MCQTLQLGVQCLSCSAGAKWPGALREPTLQDARMSPWLEQGLRTNWKSNSSPLEGSFSANSNDVRRQFLEFHAATRRIWMRSQTAQEQATEIPLKSRPENVPVVAHIESTAPLFIAAVKDEVPARTGYFLITGRWSPRPLRRRWWPHIPTPSAEHNFEILAKSANAVWVRVIIKFVRVRSSIRIVTGGRPTFFCGRDKNSMSAFNVKVTMVRADHARSTRAQAMGRRPKPVFFFPPPASWLFLQTTEITSH
ncbi:hypothetical protein C8F04DRAFT_1173100 [Mycena alexandri]|uniref:Uncharacterized protein n=1 Tax=Mycena alexandri TaxID=1745969 RepID=A0AAD6THE9_9AGAR|nr:hypothetical protein C8F04DRAFT_1173100 [Mycena alexandri]